MLKNYKFLFAVQIMVLAVAPVFAMDPEEAEQAGKAIEFLGVADGCDTDKEGSSDREDQEMDGLGMGLSSLVIAGAGDQPEAIPVIPAEPQVAAQAAEQPAAPAAAQGAGQQEQGKRCSDCGGFHVPGSRDLEEQFIAMLSAEFPSHARPASARSAAGSKKSIAIAFVNGRPVRLDFSSDSEDADSQAGAPGNIAFLMQQREAERAAARAEQQADQAEHMALLAILKAKGQRQVADQAAARVRALRAARFHGAQAQATSVTSSSSRSSASSSRQANSLRERMGLAGLMAAVAAGQDNDGLSPEAQAPAPQPAPQPVRSEVLEAQREEAKQSGCGMQ
jgi:hypothetical protein